jgi:uncharacterized integral membrane protein (TIGR00697 family)
MNIFKIEKLDLLISIYIFCIVVSEVMGAKTFPVMTIGGFTLNANVAIFVFPLIFTINDIIIEVFGVNKAKSIMRSGLVIIFLIMIYSVLVTALPPSTRFAPTEKAYDTIFALSIRFSFASLAAFAVSDLMDILVFAKLREKLGKRGLWLRTNLSNFISQLLDTVIFMVLAFYSFNEPFMMNFSFLISLIIPYWLTKCFMSIIETPLVYLGVQWFKNKK